MRLAQFWSDLEDHFPPAGVRLSLATRLGREDFELLSRLGVFVPRGVAQRYPCPRPGGEQCPRRVVDMRDGTYDAVCDNDPPECKDACGLSAHDVEQLGLDMPTLAREVGRAFETGVRCEPVAGVAHAYRTGTFALAAGFDYPIYLVVRASPDTYLAAFRSLVAANAKRGFGAMVPTDRHITDAIEREMRAAGVVIVPLARYLQVGTDGTLTVSVKPLELLRGIGRGAAAPADAAAEVVAVGRFHDGERGLTRAEYDAIVAKPSAFDIVIDQPGRRAWRRQGTKCVKHEKVRGTYFAVLREIVASRRPFDPVADSVVLAESEDAAQTCRKMRAALDAKRSKGGAEGWLLVQSVPTQDGRTAYRFSPAEGVSFAVLFDVAR